MMLWNPAAASSFLLYKNSLPLPTISSARGRSLTPTPVPLIATLGGIGNGCTKKKNKILTSTKTPRMHRITMQSVVPARDRVVAALGYVLPFFNGLQYGRYFFMQYPKAEILFEPLFPLLQAYQAVPYASFIAFFALYSAVVRNPSFSRYVRFNAMQAVVLDVLLVLPLIIQRILNPRRGLGFNILVMSYNAVFLFLVLGFLYALVSCILGRTPRLPFVGDAADAQI